MDEIAKKRILSSIPLKVVNDERIPISCGSGCFLKYKNNDLFLTVWHNIKHEGKLVIEIDFDLQNGAKCAELDGFGHYAIGNITKDKMYDVDFAYRHLKFIPCKRTYTDQILMKEIKENRIQLIDDLNTEPSADEEYGFAGYVMPKLFPKESMPDGKFVGIESTNVYHHGLKFVGYKDNFIVFKLPEEQMPHSYFKGTSGAPILDSKGNLVALVVQGDNNEYRTDKIFGLNLKKQQIILDIQCNLIPGVK